MSRRTILRQLRAAVDALPRPEPRDLSVLSDAERADLERITAKVRAGGQFLDLTALSDDELIRFEVYTRRSMVPPLEVPPHVLEAFAAQTDGAA